MKLITSVKARTVEVPAESVEIDVTFAELAAAIQPDEVAKLAEKLHSESPEKFREVFATIDSDVVVTLGASLFNENPANFLGEIALRADELARGEEIEKIIKGWDNNKLEKILLNGQNNKTQGAVPHALIQRALKSGGLIFLKPTPKEKYVDIARLNVKSIIPINFIL